MDKIVYFVVPKRGTKPSIDNKFVRDGIKYAAFQRGMTVDKVTDEMIDQAGIQFLEHEQLWDLQI